MVREFTSKTENAAQGSQAPNSPVNEGKIEKENGVVLKFGTVVSGSVLNDILKLLAGGDRAGDYMEFPIKNPTFFCSINSLEYTRDLKVNISKIPYCIGKID
ncbi:hypothetical protein AVEN_108744-1 [Araneus ventricosus]|uniref:Uncharacterized protein n=1 Tax=Araneus ventricosus TaxID=182803 RepID=A0A4Y2FBV3_ARAVE|nr:hypothetical protein AVEN_108744-1 [Araneus ventricosus]